MTETIQSREKLAEAIRILKGRGDISGIDKIVSAYKAKYQITGNNNNTRMTTPTTFGERLRNAPATVMPAMGQAAYGIGQSLIGGAKGIGSTLSGLSSIGQRGLEQTVGAGLRTAGIGAEPPQRTAGEIAKERFFTPEGSAQKGGFMAEQLAEWLVPSSKIAKFEKAATLPFKAPGIMKAKGGMALGGRMITEAGVFGGMAAAQEGKIDKEVATSALIGGAFPLVGAGLKGAKQLYQGRKYGKALGKDLDFAINKAIRPTVVGKTTQKLKQNYTEKAREAVVTITGNKKNLSLGEEGMSVSGKLPTTLNEFSQAISQTKKSIFSKYNLLAKNAGEKGAEVDLNNIARELDVVIENKALKLTHPEAISYAQEVKKRYLDTGKIDSETAQSVIQNYNNSLQAFYKNPSFDNTSKVAIDAMLVNNVRKTLDAVIEKTEGVGYQALKKQYGALKAIEKDVNHRAIVDGRKNIKGLIDFSDIFSGGQIINGIVGMHPGAIASGVTMHGIKSWFKRTNSPDRIITKMFRKAEKAMGGVETTGLRKTAGELYKKAGGERFTGGNIRELRDIKPGLTIEDITKQPGFKSGAEKQAEKFVKEGKSFGAFYKSQGETLYHGTDKGSLIKKEGLKVMPPIHGKQVMGEGLYFTPTKKESANFGKEIIEVKIKPNVKILDAHPGEMWQISVKADREYPNIPLEKAIVKMTQKEGYGGIRTIQAGNQGETYISIFDPKDVITRKELKKIWDKAEQIRKKPDLDKIRGFKKGDVPETAIRKETKAIEAGKLRAVNEAGADKIRKVPEGFTGLEGLTTKVIEKLKGKTTTSKQFISDLTNSPDLKQQEREIIREALKTEGDKVVVKDFANKVKTELLPLKVINGKKTGMASAEGYTQIGKYENIALDTDVRGNVANYFEHIYESPIKTSAGDIHFQGSSKNYFGHTRIEDMAGEIGTRKLTQKNVGQKLPAGEILARGKAGSFGGTTYKQGTTRRVIEVQSDLFQKGRLQQEITPNILFKDVDDAIYSLSNYGWSKDRIPKVIKEYQLDARAESAVLKRLKEKSKEGIGEKGMETLKKLAIQVKNQGGAEKRSAEIARLQQYNDPTAHFRMVREEVKQAAIDGKTKLQFPTGETAMKIEGMGETFNWEIILGKGKYDQLNSSTYSKIKVGQEVLQENRLDWIITDILGDGKFKAVPKEKIYNEVKKLGYDKPTIKDLQTKWKDFAETFDISSKVDASNPIYRFYEKTLGKYLKSKYNAQFVKDNKGVAWWEVDIKPEYKKLPVEAFGIIGAIGLGTGLRNNKNE